MHYGNNGVSSQARLLAVDLKPGEYRMFCKSCDYVGEPGAISFPICRCGERLWFVNQDGKEL